MFLRKLALQAVSKGAELREIKLTLRDGLRPPLRMRVLVIVLDTGDSLSKMRFNQSGLFPGYIDIIEEYPRNTAIRKVAGHSTQAVEHLVNIA